MTPLIWPGTVLKKTQFIVDQGVQKIFLMLLLLCFNKRAKIIQTVRALETTEYLTKERAYIPWKSAIDNLDYFYLMFDRSEVYGPLQVNGVRDILNVDAPPHLLNFV